MTSLASFNGSYSLAGLGEFVVVAGAWVAAAGLDLLALAFAFFAGRRRAALVACVVAEIFTSVCVHLQWQAGPGHFDNGDRLIGAAPGGLAALILITLFFVSNRSQPPEAKGAPGLRD